MISIRQCTLEALISSTHYLMLCSFNLMFYVAGQR
nr:MAG TPA: hypothetical protein [Bacteriophage sp.]